MISDVASTPRELVQEHTLLERLREGDRSSLATLYRQHRRSVYVAALSALRSRADAEEILQDTFVTMWSRRRSIALVGESTLPWLLTTARYLALNRLRAIARRKSDSLDTANELPSAGRTPLGEAMLLELRGELERAIAKLSEVDQAIVKLCLVDELSYKQAAHRLRLSQPAVRNRLSRLRAHLRTSLGNPTGEGTNHAHE